MPRMLATEYADDLAQRVHELSRRSGEEVRAEIARAIQERFLGHPGVDRAVYAGRSPENCPIEKLTENPAMQSIPALAAAAERLDKDGVTDNFRADIAFVIALLADPAFDY
ncbi:hypothetical protein [Nocardia tengchongensis]|uniref:hypothetical protein n=1 Tax=Nocardia tengchongensis TaxID=2055889 RepID=UPI00367BE51E